MADKLKEIKYTPKFTGEKCPECKAKIIMMYPHDDDLGLCRCSFWKNGVFWRGVESWPKKSD